MSASLLLLAPDFPPATGGIQTLTWEIYSRLADITRLVVAPAGSAAFGAPTHCTRNAAGRGRALAGFLREAIGPLRRAGTPPVLLHCNHLFAGYTALWLHWRLRLPYVVWVHGEELTKTRYPRLTRACLAQASAVFVNSAFTASLVGRTAGVHRVPLGASAAFLTAPPVTAPEGEVPVALTVARLSERDRYKGIDTALRAVAELRRRGQGVRYRIAGDGDDRGYLEGLARSLGVADAVEFLGRVPDEQLRGCYDAADVVLLASREQPTPRGLGFEGFGIVLLEAAARARPTVAGRSGGIPDAVEDGVTGLLADPNSPAAIADALQRLMQDRELRRRLGAAGRERVERSYNWDRAADKVRAVHKEILGQL